MPKARSEIRSIGTKGCSRSLSDATGQTSSHCCSISGSIPTSAAASTWIHLKTRGGSRCGTAPSTESSRWRRCCSRAARTPMPMYTPARRHSSSHTRVRRCANCSALRRLSRRGTRRLAGAGGEGSTDARRRSGRSAAARRHSSFGEGYADRGVAPHRRSDPRGRGTTRAGANQPAARRSLVVRKALGELPPRRHRLPASAARAL
jgi:hypothetical protein